MIIITDELSIATLCVCMHAMQPCGQHGIYSHSKDIRDGKFYSHTTGKRERNKELAM